MNILAIETATEACSVALASGADLNHRFSLEPRGHASLLLPWVGELLAEAELSLTQLDFIAFSRGPGSFTSLRIGIGVTQGLAWGAGVGVVPVSSLQTAAQKAVESGVKNAAVALDARMSEVYFAHYSVDERGLMQAITEETVSAPGAVVISDPARTYGIGNGFERYPELQELGGSLAGVYAEIWPQAAAMVPLAKDWASKNKPLDAAEAQAVYVRDDVARKSGAE